MLTGQQAKFCQLYAVEQNGTAAYLAAYPKSSEESARRSASDLLTNPDIQSEIARIRQEAERQPGGAVLTLAEVHDFLARLVRAKIGELPHDSDLFTSIEPTEFGHRYKLPDKLAAIARWCDIKGEGSEAKGSDALAGLLERCMK